VWRKLDTSRNTGPVKRPLESGIESQIPRLPLFIDDGANFPGPGIRGKDGPLVAQFRRKAHPDRPMPFLRNANPGTDVITNPLVALVRAVAREDVQSRFKPVRPTLGNLNRFVGLMFIRKNALVNGLETFKGEVTVQLDHSAAGRHRVGSIDLNLVVALRIERQRSYGSQEGELNAFDQSRLHRFYDSRVAGARSSYVSFWCWCHL